MADGFNVILGSYLTQLAAFLTMVLVIRTPPEYETPDSDRTFRAKIIFSFLVLLHLTLAIFKYVIIWVTARLWEKMPYFMFTVVLTAALIQQNWIFDSEGFFHDWDSKTPEQKKFEAWLALELIIIGGYICGGSLYILCHKLKTPPIFLSTYTSVEE